ncbi:MAG: DUF4340 domain-containing protein [Fimbriiglobus sp.]
MRWIVTFLLILAASLTGAWLVYETWILPTTQPVPVNTSLTRLGQLGNPANIRKVSVTLPNQPALTLTRNPDGTWSQPGNWPVRESEVEVLINAIVGLKSRFQPLPYTAELTEEYGLTDKQRLTIVADVEEDKVTRSIQLHLGQAKLAPGMTEFTRPCYALIDDLGEVLQLGPEAYATLARSPEVYRRRQLLTDVERVKFPSEGFNPLNPSATATGRVPILGDRYQSITVEKLGSGTEKPRTLTFTRMTPTPKPSRDPDRPTLEATLSAERLAAAWQVTRAFPDDKFAPAPNTPEPTKFKTLQTALAELWVEGFLTGDKAKPEATGLDKPEQKWTFQLADKKSLTLLVGKVTRSKTTVEEPARPPQPGMPPMPPKTSTEEYRAAKLAENDLVFEIRTDKLPNIPTTVDDDYRDPRLARFDSGDAQVVKILRPGQAVVELVKKPGQKNAEKEDDRQDRWTIGDQLADRAKVTELIDAITKIEAKKETSFDRLEAADRTKFGLDEAAKSVVEIFVTPRVAEGDAALPNRMVTVALGKVDDKKLVPVEIGPRTVQVEEALLKLVERPAIAYRSRRLLDMTDITLTAVKVLRGKEPSFTLQSKPKPAPEVGVNWNFTQPVSFPTDSTKAEPFVSTWSGLDAVEYVSEKPTPEELEKTFALKEPRYTLELGFSNSKTAKLEIGGPRPNKPETFARLNNGPVFSIPDSAIEKLVNNGTDLVSTELWKLDAAKLDRISIQRGSETTTLELTTGVWKLTQPFNAPMTTAAVEPLTRAVATLQAAKFETLAPKDLVSYGLDQPKLRLLLRAGDQSRAVKLGKATPTGGMYAQLENDPNTAIFELPGNIPALLDIAPLERLDKNLLTLDPTQVSSVKLSSAKAEDSITLTKQANGTWKATEAPFAIDPQIMQQITFLASRPAITKLAGYGDSVKWADFGLDQPTTTVRIELETTPPAAAIVHTLKLGKTNAEGGRYVRIDDGQALAVMNPRAAEGLTKTKLDFVDRNLLSFDPATVTSFIRTQGKEILEIAPQGVNWEIVQPAKFKADKPTIEDLADTLSRLRAAKIAAYAPTDLKPFGLSDNPLTLTLKLADATKTLKLGKTVDDKTTDRYVLVEGDGPKVVGILLGAVAAKLTGAPIKYRDKALAKFIDADKLTLERAGREATFAKVNGTWKLTTPTTADAEQADLDELINALATLRADELIAEKPSDLAPFGLKKPEATWKLFASDKAVLTLLLGKKDTTGRVHAMLDKGEMVVLLDPILTNKVLAEYRKRAIFADVDASQIDNITITNANGPNTVFQKIGAIWSDPAKPMERLDTTKINELLAAVAGLKAERYAADTKPDLKLFGLEKPSRVIVVSGRNGQTTSLAIGGPEGTSSGKQVYAKVSDPTRPEVFVLSEADTAKLSRSRADFTDKK